MVHRVRLTSGGGCGPHMCEDGLYFARHSGKYIYQLNEYGEFDRVLCLEETPCIDHIASPHMSTSDDLLFYHGKTRDEGQKTFVWDGVDHYGPIAPYYLRPWVEWGEWYGVCKVRMECHLYYGGTDPSEPWKFERRLPLPGKIRHAFYDHKSGWLYFTRIGDSPERIIRSSLEGSQPSVVLEPHEIWEGANEPIEPSKPGGIGRRVCQLRDPMVYDGCLYYAYGGEQGIAKASLV